MTGLCFQANKVATSTYKLRPTGSGLMLMSVKHVGQTAMRPLCSVTEGL